MWLIQLITTAEQELLRFFVLNRGHAHQSGKQFCEASVNILVCAPDTWTFPQLTVEKRRLNWQNKVWYPKLTLHTFVFSGKPRAYALGFPFYYFWRFTKNIRISCNNSPVKRPYIYRRNYVTRLSLAKEKRWIPGIPKRCDLNLNHS